VIGFRFVADHRADYRVTDLCRVAGVSRSGYYAWRRRPLSARRRADTLLLEEIRTIHQDSLGTYGRPRIWGQLRRQGLEVGATAGRSADAAEPPGRSLWAAARAAPPYRPGHRPGP
jgi:hypothetical protein